MWLVLLSSLVLLSAQVVVSMPFSEKAPTLEKFMADKLSIECYEDLEELLENNNKFNDFATNFKLSKGWAYIDQVIGDRLSDFCKKEMEVAYNSEKKVIDTILGRFSRSADNQADIDVSRVPHPIVVEWENLKDIINRTLPEGCREQLEDIIKEHSMSFRHLFGSKNRLSRDITVYDIPHSIDVEWENLKAVIARKLSCKCLGLLKENITKHKESFTHLFPFLSDISNNRVSRSAEFLDNLASIPQKIVDWLRDGNIYNICVK